LGSERTHLDGKRVLAGACSADRAQRCACKEQGRTVTARAAESLSPGLVARFSLSVEKMTLFDLSMSFSIIRGKSRCSVIAKSDWDSSLLLGDHLHLLADGEGSLLSVDHDLEALEVGEVGAKTSLGQLLSNGGGGPLGGEIGFLGSSDQGASAGSFLDVNLHSGERQSLERVNHSWEVLSVNENSVGVSNVHDGDLLSVVHSEVNECNSAGFHEVFVSLHEKKEESGKVRNEKSPHGGTDDTQASGGHLWRVGKHWRLACTPTISSSILLY